MPFINIAFHPQLNNSMHLVPYTLCTIKMHTVVQLLVKVWNICNFDKWHEYLDTHAQYTQVMYTINIIIMIILYVYTHVYTHAHIHKSCIDKHHNDNLFQIKLCRPVHKAIKCKCVIQQFTKYGTGKKKRLSYLVGNLVATNWPIEKALHAIGYNQIPTK